MDAFCRYDDTTSDASSFYSSAQATSGLGRNEKSQYLRSFPKTRYIAETLSRGSSPCHYSDQFVPPRDDDTLREARSSAPKRQKKTTATAKQSRSAKERDAAGDKLVKMVMVGSGPTLKLLSRINSGGDSAVWRR